ncbi:MAG: hypothetical protein U0326_38365 [Polyangiales bacterium]
MHAQRYDHEDDDALEAAPRIDVSRGPENDNDAPAHEDDDPSPPIVGDIVPRGPSRRAWITAALVAATLSLGAFAWTRPRPTAQAAATPAVTAVDIAAMATPVPDEAPAESALLVIQDEAPRPRGHVHGAHAGSAASPTEQAAPAPSADESVTREPEPREARHGRGEASATREAREASEAVEAAAPRATSRALATREAAAQAPQAQEATSKEETETALPTDSADEVVEHAVGEHSDAIERCIDAADDEAEGRVTVHLVIARDGAVRSATPQGPDALRDVGRCIAREMRSWRMVVPDATGDTTISWPFEVESNAN